MILALAICLPSRALSTLDDVRIVDAAAAYTAGRYDEARTILDSLAAVYPADDAVSYYTGLCVVAKGDRAGALPYFEKAAAADSTNSWYRNVLASEYIAAGRPEEAIPLLKGLVKQFPAQYNTPYILTMLGDAAITSLRDTTALEYYERALELDPNYAPAELGISDVSRIRGNMPAYFLRLGNVIHNEEVFPEAKTSILTRILGSMDARFYQVWGKQFTKLVDDAAQMHPDQLPLKMLKMRMRFIEQDNEGAEAVSREIIELSIQQKNDAQLVEAYSILGDLYYEKGDMKTTFEIYDKALAVDPEYAPVLNNYAYWLSLSGKKLRKALSMSKITVQNNPDNATYLDTYAWILHLLHRDAEAKPYLKHAMIYGGRENKDVLLHYSIVLRSLGEYELSEYYRGLAEAK